MRRGRELALGWALLALAARPAMADEVAWYRGEIDGQPCIVVREAWRRTDTGEWRTERETHLVLAKPREVRLATREITLEGEGGSVHAFEFVILDGSGKQQLVTGTVDAQARTVRWQRSGEDSHVTLVPSSAVPTGPRGIARLLAEVARGREPRTFFVLQLNDQPSSQERRASSRPNGVVRVLDPANGLAIDYRLDATGSVQGMDYQLGGQRVSVRRVGGPVAAEAGVLADAASCPGEGHPREHDGATRYRLPDRLAAAAAAGPLQALDGSVLTVRRASDQVAAPGLDELREADELLEGDAGELRTWVRKAIEHSATTSAQIRALASAARARVQLQPWFAADASALETFRARRGDCTELATLVCATLRVAGIAARVDLGLVYLREHRRWVAHAWNTVFDHELQQWVHLDATRPEHPRSHYVSLGALPASRSERAAMLARLLGAIGREPIVALGPQAQD